MSCFRWQKRHFPDKFHKLSQGNVNFLGWPKITNHNASAGFTICRTSSVLRSFIQVRKKTKPFVAGGEKHGRNLRKSHRGGTLLSDKTRPTQTHHTDYITKYLIQVDYIKYMWRVWIRKDDWACRGVAKGYTTCSPLLWPQRGQATRDNSIKLHQNFHRFRLLKYW